MTTENGEQTSTEIQNQDTEAEQTSSATDTGGGDDEAAFAAGFASARGEPSDAEPEAREARGDDSTSDDGGDKGAKDAKDDDGAAPQSEFMTREQFDEALNAATAPLQAEIRRLNGRYGELNGKLSSGPRKITKEDLPKVAAEYPDLADVLVEDLSNLESSPAAAPGATAEQINELRDEFNERVLNLVSPGWKDTLQSPEYAGWLKTLPQERSEQILSSENPEDVVSSIREFSDWTGKQEAARKAAAAKAKRLAAAEPATKGGASPTERHAPLLDAEAAFEQGFKSVRSGGHR